MKRRGEGFAFFTWRVLGHPGVQGDAWWWDFWKRLDFELWRKRVL